MHNNMLKLEVNELPEADQKIHYEAFCSQMPAEGVGIMHLAIRTNGVEVAFGYFMKELQKKHPLECMQPDQRQALIDSIWNAYLYADRLRVNNN